MGLILLDNIPSVGGFSNIKVGNGSGMNASAPPLVPARLPHAYWRVRNAFHRTDVVVLAGLEFRTTVGGANVATGGTALASENSGTAGNLFDGNVGTLWISGTGWGTYNQWIGYQFSSPVDINQIAITARDINNFSAIQTPMWGYIEYSDNGSTWTIQDIFATDVWTSNQIKTFTVGSSWNTKKRVFKLDLYNGNSYWDYKYTAAIEVEFRSSIGVSNSGVGAGITSATGYSGAAWNAFDGNTGTGIIFSDASPNNDLIYWFNDAPTIRQIAYTNRCDGWAKQAPTEITLKSSVDAGATWVTEQTWTGLDWTFACETKTFNLTNPIIP